MSAKSLVWIAVKKFGLSYHHRDRYIEEIGF